MSLFVQVAGGQYFIRNGVSCVRVAFGIGLTLGGFGEAFGQGLGDFLGLFWPSYGVLTAMLCESNIRVLYSRLGKPILTDFGKFWKFLGSVLGAF